jgi:xanthine dehydrogenase YagT iron-sulfur-binding subunit
MTSIGVGAIAPAIERKSIAPWQDDHHQPWVLAFIAAGLPRDPDELDAIRAHLRGLGTALLVVSRTGAWSFSPDDDIEGISNDPRNGDELRAAFAVGDRDAVYVIDHARVVRFAGEAIEGSLADALAAAAARIKPSLSARSWFEVDRREFAIASLCSGFALLLFGCKERPKPEPAPIPAPAPEEVDVTIDINGTERRLRIDPRVSVLDLLRERLGLTGTKKGCDAGQCGACTVLVDGNRLLGCLTLAASCDHRKLVTIEGLANGDQLHPMQAAFIEHDGFQCGYCTSGQIMSAVGLVSEGVATTDAEVREQMSGNLCRCGAYPNIVAAIQAARRGHA